MAMAQWPDKAEIRPEPQSLVLTALEKWVASQQTQAAAEGWRLARCVGGGNAPSSLG